METSIVADSNITNSTKDGAVLVDYGGVILPVPIDPRYRARADIGFGIAGSAGARLPFNRKAALALNAEGYRVDYAGNYADDVSLQAAAGVEMAWTPQAKGSLQLIGFERWYRGIVATAGWGVRGSHSQQIARGKQLTLAGDWRAFRSDYGKDLGGTQAYLSLTNSIVLAPNLTVSAGAFGRRTWRRAKTYSNIELGGYGAVGHYLNRHLTAGLSAGVTRVRFDQPILFLSPDKRSDWRWFSTAYLTTRKPIGAKLWPTISYSYNQTDSSIDYYHATRHRLRLSLRRAF